MANFDENLTVSDELNVPQDNRGFLDKSTGALFGTTKLGVAAVTGKLKDAPKNQAERFDIIEQQVKNVDAIIKSRRSKGPEGVEFPVVDDEDASSIEGLGQLPSDKNPYAGTDKKGGAFRQGFLKLKENLYDGLLLSELYQPEALDIIKQHEAYRTGKTVTQGYSEEEIVDNFLTFQRYLEDLNLQVTSYHMKRTMTGSNRQANTFAKGQMLFDYLGHAFQARNSPSEKRKAIKDHFLGTMTSIENVYTLGSTIAIKNAGVKTLAAKLSGPRVMRTYRKIFKDAKQKYDSALSLAENINKSKLTDAGKKALSEKAEFAKREIERNIFKNITNSQVMKQTKSYFKKAGNTLPQAIKSIDRTAVWTAAAIDSTSAAFTDWLGQKTRQFHDPNREYGKLQTTIMATTGAIGGVVAKATQMYGNASNAIKYRKENKNLTELQKTKRSLGSFLYNEYLENDARIKALAAKQNVSEVVDPTNAAKWSGADTTIKLNKIKFISFYDKAKKGAPLRFTREGLPLDFEETINFTWLFGNQREGIKGVVDTLQEYGISYEGKRIGLKNEKGEVIQDNFANWFLDVLKALPAPVRKEIEETYNATLKKSNPQYKDKTLNEAYTMLAAEIRSAGKTLGQQSYLSQVLGNAINKEAIEKQIKEFGGSLTPDAPFQKGMSDIAYLQSTFIRSMITHPGTTGINLYGWRIGTALQTVSDMSRLLVFGGQDAINHVLDMRNFTARNKAPFWHEKTRSLADGVRYKMKGILSPYTTMNEFEDTLRMFPTDSKALSQYVFGGISELSELQKLNDSGLILGPKSRKKIDAGMEVMQNLWMVRLFDTYSKAIELKKMMAQKTKEVYGIDYESFIKTEQFAREVQNGKWSINVMAPSVDAASRMTYAKSFGKTFAGSKERGLRQPIVEVVGQVAKIIEGARNFPYFGTKIPFGQFHNNHVSTLMDFTGVSLAHHLFLRATGRGELITRDVSDVAARGAVGMSIIAYMGVEQVKRLDRGLPWTVDDDATGQPGSIVFQFPRSLFDGPARMVAHAYKGEVGSTETTWDQVKESYKMYFSNPENLDKWENGQIPKDLVQDIIRTMGTAGLTRQLQSDLNAFVMNMYDAVLEDDPEFVQHFHWSWQRMGSDMFSIPFRMVEPIDEGAELFFGDSKDFIIKDKRSGNEYYKKAFSYIDFMSDKLLELVDAPDSLRPVQKYQAFSEDPIVRNISGVNRPEAVPNHIIKMMTDIGVPKYKLNRRGLFPEADNQLNALVPHLANILAQDKMLEDDYINGSVRVKKDMWRGVVKMARAKAKELMLAKTVGTSDEQARFSNLITVDQLVNSDKNKLKAALRFYEFRDEDGEIITDAFELDNPDLLELIQALEVENKNRRDSSKSTKQDLRN